MMNEIEVKKFNFEDHYQEVSLWWEKSSWPIIPKSHLSQNGYIVYSNDEPACVGWLYQTDSAFCIFEWVVANPNVRKERRSKAILALVEHVKNVARLFGFETIFMSVKNLSLINRLESCGFKKTDMNTINLILNLKGA